MCLLGSAGASRGREVVDLFVGEVPVLALAHAWQVHAAVDVAGEPAVLERNVEDQAEHSMDLVNVGGGSDPC